MDIELILKKKVEKCNMILFDIKTNIFIFKPKKKLKNIFNFILLIKYNNDNKKLYQIVIDDNKLTKFIKNKIEYYQVEKNVDYNTVIFRFDEKQILNEIIIKKYY